MKIQNKTRIRVDENPYSSIITQVITTYLHTKR
jgi:hypothetical protein